MSAEIVKLNKARKAKAGRDKEQRAAENRVVHGRTKAERQREAMVKERARREIEGARRDVAAGHGDGGPVDDRE